MESQKQEGQEQKETIEEAFTELSAIVEQLEAPDVTLERAMELYRAGVTRLRQCEKALEQAETELITLTEEGEMPDGNDK